MPPRGKTHRRLDAGQGRTEDAFSELDKHVGTESIFLKKTTNQSMNKGKPFGEMENRILNLTMASWVRQGESGLHEAPFLVSPLTV